MRARGLVVVVLAALAAGACAYPVEGDFAGRRLARGRNPALTIVVIHNHGFSNAHAGTYRPVTPPILWLAEERNPDVVVFSQVRNTLHMKASDHAAYIEAAIAYFHDTLGIPLENIILAGQSCGGWGSLQAAAEAYPQIGGVIGFAPTCHGKLPHPPEVQRRREAELRRLADHLHTAGTIFLYEGDSYYDVADWDTFESRVRRAAVGLHVERVSRARILQLCAKCATDSHGAYWDPRFARAFYDRVQALIDRVRERIHAHTATSSAAPSP